MQEGKLFYEGHWQPGVCLGETNKMVRDLEEKPKRKNMKIWKHESYPEVSDGEVNLNSRKQEEKQQVYITKEADSDYVSQIIP